MKKRKILHIKETVFFSESQLSNNIYYGVDNVGKDVIKCYEYVLKLTAFSILNNIIQYIRIGVFYIVYCIGYIMPTYLFHTTFLYIRAKKGA